MSNDNDWLKDLKPGDLVGLRHTTFTVTMYRLAKVERITPTGIIRLITLPGNSQNGGTGGGYSNLNFRMNNTQIKDKSQSFSSTFIDLVPVEIANQQMLEQQLTKQKYELALELSTTLRANYKFLPLYVLELIDLKLKQNLV